MKVHKNRNVLSESISTHCPLLYCVSDRGTHTKGTFNYNYVNKKRGEGVSRKSTLGHVTRGQGRYHMKSPKLSSRGEKKGQNLVEFGPRSCWMTPNFSTLLERWSNFSFLFIKVNVLSLLLPVFLVKLININEHSFCNVKTYIVKFVFCKKFTKNHEIFTVNLTFTWVSVKLTVRIL